MRAQCIIIKAYMNGEFDLNISHENALLYCQRYIESLATITSLQDLPNEYFIVPLKLKELSFHNKTASILNIYYNLLYAQHTNNTEKIKTICSVPQPKAVSLRHSIFNLLCSNQNDRTMHVKIKALTPDSKKLHNFCESDGFIALPLLTKKLESVSNHKSPLANALHYFLGLLIVKPQLAQK